MEDAVSGARRFLSLEIILPITENALSELDEDADEDAGKQKYLKVISKVISNKIGQSV
jgi:hypothetical protein